MGMQGGRGQGMRACKGMGGLGRGLGPYGQGCPLTGMGRPGAGGPPEGIKRPNRGGPPEGMGEVWVWAGQVRADRLKVSRDRDAVVLPKMKMWTNKVRRCHAEVWADAAKASKVWVGAQVFAAWVRN
jgi:hypothetical protein